MTSLLEGPLSPVLFIPHGGGPLPLLGDKGHRQLVSFLEDIAPALGTPSAICVISAHWEEQVATITSGESPALIYDYYGFPGEAYDIQYPAAGSPKLAKRIFDLLKHSGIDARLDDHRGFGRLFVADKNRLFRQGDINLRILYGIDPADRPDQFALDPPELVYIFLELRRSHFGLREELQADGFRPGDPLRGEFQPQIIDGVTRRKDDTPVPFDLVRDPVLL